jgi:hypothetical protein
MIMKTKSHTKNEPRHRRSSSRNKVDRIWWQ